MTPLRIDSFGAVADGQTDNTAIINGLLLAAKSQKQPVFIPEGDWAHTGPLTVDGVEMYGEGDKSILRALTPAKAAVVLTGVAPRLHNMRLTGVVPPTRLSNWEAHRVSVHDAQDFLVEDLLVDTSAASSIYCAKAVRGHISNNRVIGMAVPGATYSTLRADTIHITDNSNNILIEDNRCVLGGDDGIAVVSYQKHGGMVHHITARRNKISDQLGGRGMTVIGGADILYEHNTMDNNVGAAGLLLAQENSYSTYAPHRVIIRNNTIRNCGNLTIGHAGLHLSCNGWETGEDILIDHNLITQNDTRHGIRVTGVWTGVVLEQNIVVSPTPYVLKTPDVVVRAYVEGPVGGVY
jgi:hypothetical protein